MRILIVTARGRKLPPTLPNRLAERNCLVETVERHPISAFTSMRIARGATDCQAVLAQNSADALAAISARKLAKDKFRVVCALPPNAPRPILTAEIKSGVDLWLAPSPLSAAFLDASSKARVLPPTSLDTSMEHLPHPTAEASSVRMLWCGPLDGNLVRLKQAIHEIDQMPEGSQLAVCGTSKAQHVMPAVRMSRAISQPDRVEWKGEQFDLHQEAANAQCIVQASAEPTGLETSICASGRALINPEQMSQWQALAEGFDFSRYSSDNILDLFTAYCNDIL